MPNIIANPPKENITTGSLANMVKKFIFDSLYTYVDVYDCLIYRKYID